MSNTISLSDLHGVSLPKKDNEDEGCCIEERKEDNMKYDDVFVDDDSNLKSLNGSEFGNLKSFLRNRHQTSKSSGYESEIQTSAFETEKNSKISFCFSNSRNLIFSSKEKRNVFSQTDFPSEDEDEHISREESTAASPVLNQNWPQKKVDNFCWRHDSVYDKLIFPPARPSSTSSVSEANKIIQKRINPLMRLSLNNKSCDQCKLEETAKIDLGSRKQSNSLKKKSLCPSVANVKDCPLNLLPEELENCSTLWMENRTFYIGTPKKKTCSSLGIKQRSQSLSAVPKINFLKSENFQPNACVLSEKENRQQKRSLKHFYWVQKTSFACEKKMPSSIKSETKQRNKRDWILVQHVTKFVLRRNSCEFGFKTSYRKLGDQEMVLCPNELRSVDYIEEICCQHFIHVTRRKALDEKRNIELLFSPKGPMIREDKDLEGRSIFFFCCDFSIQLKKPKKKIAQENKDVIQEAHPDPQKFKVDKNSVLEKDFEKTKKERRIVVHSSTVKTSQLDLTSRHRHLADNRTSALAKSFHRPAFLRQSTDKQDEDVEASQTVTKKLCEDLTTDDIMKKSVRFADCSKKNSDDDTKKKDLLRRASLPPPPPQFLENLPENVMMSRKRRWSFV